MTTTSIDGTRSKLREALAPEVREGKPSPDGNGFAARSAPQPRAVAGFSVIECVSEGIDAWWNGSTMGRAAQVMTPLVEPYLRPLVRRHYQALLIGSAAAGALISRYPGRSTQTIFKIAGPVMLSSVMLEVGKAGLRQLNRRP